MTTAERYCRGFTYTERCWQGTETFYTQRSETERERTSNISKAPTAMSDPGCSSALTAKFPVFCFRPEPHKLVRQDGKEVGVFFFCFFKIRSNLLGNYFLFFFLFGYSCQGISHKLGMVRENGQFCFNFCFWISIAIKTQLLSEKWRLKLKCKVYNVKNTFKGRLLPIW